MKLSLALGPREPLSRQSAWGCFTTNLTMPGFGSLLGGDAVGYAQIPLTVVGFILSLIGTVRAMIRLGGEWGHLKQLQEIDPAGYMMEVWTNLRWPLVGIGLFFFAACWALLTSLSILSESRAQERVERTLRPRPPKL